MDYVVVNDVALPMVTKAVIVDCPFRPTCKNYHSHVMLHLNHAPLQAGQLQAACTTVRWVPGSEQLWEQHMSALGFTDGLLQATWQSRATPVALNIAVKGLVV